MGGLSDAELYRRGAETLRASWEAYARGARRARVVRRAGVAAAVFPEAPERAVYNNALLTRDLAAGERTDALAAMEEAYASAGVSRFAAWVHESDEPLRLDVEARGYRFDQATRAMGMALADLRMPRPEIDLAPPDWSEYLRTIGVPTGFLAGVDQGEFHVRLARLEGETVASALAFDHGDDCGIYNVSTLAAARRRGLGTALTVLLAHDAAARGCRTASIQATEMAERLYARVGFRDLGRFLEYVP